jgi:hypothetical protein
MKVLGELAYESLAEIRVRLSTQPAIAF